MRLSELIARLEPENLKSRVYRVVPGASEINPALWPHNLESILTSSGHVEQVIVARRPPVLALLLSLLEADDYKMERTALRARTMAETDRWCTLVDEGNLANRAPAFFRIYRRLLTAAWRNDHILDESETHLLGLLRKELGMFQVEHFLLAHHSEIQQMWRESAAFDFVVSALTDEAVLYALDGEIVLPQELVQHVRSALGVQIRRDATKRLYEALDSGKHLKSALGDHDLPTSGSKADRIERLVDHFVPTDRVLDTMHIDDLRDLVRKRGCPVAGSKQELVERIMAHYDSGQDLLEPETSQEEAPEQEPRELTKDQFSSLFTNLKGHQLRALLAKFNLKQSGAKEERVATLWDSHLSETSILAKLKNPELSDLLSSCDLDGRGSKDVKIHRLIQHFYSDDAGSDETEHRVQSVPRQVSCSRCGGIDDLHVVTVLMVGPSNPGRLLIYCKPCRDWAASMLGVSVPLDDFGRDDFLRLYRQRLTESDPETASNLIFGRPVPELIEGARNALASRS